MTRIDWSPDGARVLVCQYGAVELRALDGGVVRRLPSRVVELGGAPQGGAAPFTPADAPYLDARWLADGRIVAVDGFGLPTMFSLHGEPYSDPIPPRNPWRRAHASIAGGGTVFASITDRYLGIHSTAPVHEQYWFFHFGMDWYGLPGSVTAQRAELSPDGTQVVIDHDLAWGPSWLVLALAHEPPEARELDRQTPGAPPLRCVFTRASKRVIVADPWGRDAPLALDDHGVRVVYAVPPGEGEATVRVDFLGPARGARIAPIAETRWIEPGIGPLAAVSVGPGDRIACLGASGAIELAPIP